MTTPVPANSYKHHRFLGEMLRDHRLELHVQSDAVKLQQRLGHSGDTRVVGCCSVLIVISVAGIDPMPGNIPKTPCWQVKATDVRT
jgi:hypothetical protein